MTNANIPTVDEIKAMLTDLRNIDETLFESGASQMERQEIISLISRLNAARRDAKVIHSALETGDKLGGFLNKGIKDLQSVAAAYNDYKASH